jgi:CRP-like cAMP-binding protein
MISPSLKQKVAISIFNITLQKNRLFRNLFASKVKFALERNEGLQKLANSNKLIMNKLQYNIIKQLVRHLKTKLTSPEEIIIRSFDDTTDMFIISKGEVQVTVIDERKPKLSESKPLLPGDFFGEIALIYECRRTA